jgi:HK97 family phage prohead protease
MSVQAPAIQGLERRSVKVRELRTVQREGQTYLTGYAANYGVLSEDLGGWRERIQPGFFARALRDQHDVRHLQNHNPDLVLGRTKAGTTTLREDAQGLAFETRLGKRSYEVDLAESVERGDVDEMSFGFVVAKGGERWVKENGVEVRELLDGELFDVSTVTYPAYPGTTAGLDSRSLFPHGAPVELRSHLAADPAAAHVARVAEIRTWQRGAARSRRRPGAELRSVVAGEGLLEIFLYGDIGESWDWWSDDKGITAKTVRAELERASGYSRIRVRLSSLGGDAYEGIAIFNLLRAQGKPIEVCVDGVALSAASIIAMAGDEISMGSNTLMMIHNAWSYQIGNAAELRAAAAWLDTVDRALAQTYVDRTKLSYDVVKALMDATTYMTAAECLAQGFCTKVTPEVEQATITAAAERSRLPRGQYRSAPESLRQMVAAADEDVCECACEKCAAGECSACSNADCADTNCAGCPNQTDSGQEDRRRRLRLMKATL